MAGIIGGVSVGIAASGSIPALFTLLLAFLPVSLAVGFGPTGGAAGAVLAVAILGIGGWRHAGWPPSEAARLDWAVAGVLLLALGTCSGWLGRSHVSRALKLMQVVRDLRRARAVLAALYESGKIITSEIDLDRLITRLLRLVDRMFGYPHPAILLVQDDGGALQLVGATGYDAPKGLVIPFDRGITGYVARTGRALKVDDVDRDPRYIPGVRRSRSELAVPIRIQDRVIGVLNVESPKIAAFTPEDVDILQSVADQAAVAIQNARLMGLTSQMAVTDGLTELYNRRHLMQQIELQTERSRRGNRSLSLLLVDIDDFKLFNDRYGHLVGDEVLRSIGHLIRSSIRHSDVAARYGGEEFAVLLPDTGPDAAMSLARRIQSAIPNAGILLAGPAPGETAVTVSIGVASFPRHARTWRGLLEAADGACYAAKRQGKNCAVMADDAATPPPEGCPAPPEADAAAGQPEAAGGAA